MFRPVRELCKNMNDLFDLCNSKNPDVGQASYQVVVTLANSVKIANKFLQRLEGIYD
jgi:hypothetical protein